MDNIVSNILQTLQTGANIIAYLASQAGYEIDTTTILSTVATVIALYFALLSLYRTITYAIRTAIFIIKWGVILVVIAGTAGFFMSGGQGGFTLLPVFNALFAQALKLLVWGAMPQVDLGPEGLRVNGVKMELPQEYHQYGEAWNKFKRSSKKATAGSGWTAPFTDSATNKKSRSKSKAKKNLPTDAAAIAQRLLSGDLSGVAGAWQSVEAIQKGVSESFDALKTTLGLKEEEILEPVVEEAEGIWAGLRSWWDRESWKDDEEGKTTSR
ncbi:hypothetical protein FRB96_005496 [Tulasnella sp. 330]|nr:hypothetical protein FRB96_005496 [Tulasnella sp. 330]KAG8877404.1 hypothetical protein FRB97_003445 [Tulasnella sp. 331]